MILFIAMELIAHKESIKTIGTKGFIKKKTRPVAATSDSNEMSMGDIGLVIDNSMRANAITILQFINM